MDKLWKTLEEDNIENVKNKILLLAKQATKEKPLKIAGHGDADGITSAVLLVSALNTPHIEVDIKSRFRNYGDADIAVDLGAPPTEDFKGVAIDHHDHPSWDGQYYLIWDNKPTSRIVYDLFKDKIPDEHKWKVVVGIAGDGQPELIPDEIWDKFGTLLFTGIDTIEGQYYGKYTHWEAPLYSLMNSPINQIAKTGNTYEAYAILKKADNPFDIIWHPMALTAKKRIKEVLKQITSPKTPADKLRLITFKRLPVIFCSVTFEESVTSDIAYRIRNIHKYKTVIVVNSKTLSGSIRGDLAKYIANKLASLGFEAGGHPGYCGITLRNDKDVPKLLGALAKICS